MTRKRTSFAFLMEMLWVCGFFILASCIFVLAFVKADRLSRHASDLSQAVTAAENAVEETFSQYGEPLPGGKETDAVLYFDRGWNLLEAPDSSDVPDSPNPPDTLDSHPVQAASYRISVHTSWQDQLLTVRADVFSRAKSSGSEDEALYSLTGTRFYPSGEKGVTNEK